MIQKAHHYFLPNKHNGYHPHVLRHRHLSVIAIGAVVLKLILLAGLSFAIPSRDAFAEVVIGEVVQYTNQARVSAGLQPVTMHETLNYAASLKAQDMVNKGYFDHYGPNGETPWQWFHTAGYRYTRAGENLASNFVEAETAHQAWMASPTHRDNILNEHYRDIGIAIATGEIDGQQTTIVVQLFGSTDIPIVEIPGEQNTVAVNGATDTVDQEVFPKGSVVVESEEITSTITPVENQPFWIAATNWLRQFYLIAAGVLSLIILITIAVRLEIQHHKTIAKALAVVGVLMLLSAIEIHFMEGFSRFVEIL